MFTRDQFMQLEFEQKKEVLEFRAKFHAKKSKATAEIERVEKNGYNAHHKYPYATESDVKTGVRKILFENKLSFNSDLLDRHESERNPKNGMTNTTVKMVFIITDTETGYFEEFEHIGTAMDNGDKGIYKAYSNTIKYALMDYFLIATGDDVEKDSPVTSAQNKQQPQQNKQQNNQQNNRNNQQQNNQQQNKQQPQQNNQRPSSNDKPTWKKIMDAEDQLVELAGTTKSEIRNRLMEEFGQIDKYKELEKTKAEAIYNQLLKWIDQYKNPQS